MWSVGLISSGYPGGTTLATCGVFWSGMTTGCEILTGNQTAQGNQLALALILARSLRMALAHLLTAVSAWRRQTSRRLPSLLLTSWGGAGSRTARTATDLS